MTIEEKRAYIMHHCDLEKECENCKLAPITLGEYCYSEGSDVERNYNILFGAGNIEAAYTPDSVLRHEHICAELNELYARKNADYGDSFHKTYIEEGMAMARIRLTDKLERFKRLSKSGEQNVKNENIRDTLIDLANYAIMTVMEMDTEN